MTWLGKTRVANWLVSLRVDKACVLFEVSTALYALVSCSIWRATCPTYGKSRLAEDKQSQSHFFLARIVWLVYGKLNGFLKHVIRVNGHILLHLANVLDDAALDSKLLIYDILQLLILNRWAHFKDAISCTSQLVVYAADWVASAIEDAIILAQVLVESFAALL